jgi:3-hydroxyacyl-CoA dehydrogenase/3-hydroxy-2-methylbutyryl-CoA dehydrogenase
MKIAGKTAIVTGGASGLGEAAAVRLHEAGANVVIADLNEEKGNALAAKLGDRALFVKCNVTSTDDVKATIKAAVDKFGALHILVNNAGIGSAGRTFNKDGPWNIDWFKMVVDIPDGYFFVDAIPHNYIGKIEKNVLRKMYAEKDK